MTYQITKQSNIKNRFKDPTTKTPKTTINLMSFQQAPSTKDWTWTSKKSHFTKGFSNQDSVKILPQINNKFTAKQSKDKNKFFLHKGIPKKIQKMGMKTDDK